MIGGHLEDGKGSRKAHPPVGAGGVARRLDLRAPLPRRKVEVLNGELRKLGRGATGRAFVERCQLTEQDADRSPVRDDVMEDEPEDVVFRPETNQPGSEEWTLGEVERARELLSNAPDRLAQTRLDRSCVEVDDRERDGLLWPHTLEGPAFVDRKGRPQGLVTRHERRQSRLQGIGVERTAEPDRPAFVVDRAVRTELLEEPEP